MTDDSLPDSGPGPPEGERPGSGLATDSRRGLREVDGRVQVFGVSVLLFLALRGMLGGWGIGGVAVAEWMAFVGFPVLLLRRSGQRLAEAVHLRRPGSRAVVGSVVVGLAGLPVSWTVFWLQSPWVTTDPAVVEALNRELLPTGPASLLLLIAVAVVTPAVCEEVALRGLLLRGLRAHGGWAGAIGGSGLVFGLLHWSPGAASRVLPTVALGLILGWTVWRSGTLWTAVLAHLTHNLVILLLAAAVAVESSVPTDPGMPPAPFLLVGVAFLTLGGHLLAPTPHDAVPHDPQS